MSVLIDTSIWSLGLRRRRRDLNPAELRAYHEWENLLIQGEATIIGPIRQETLSGIAIPKQFEDVRLRLSLVEDLSIDTDTFILAAEFFNSCRAAGIAPGNIDMTICAAAHVHAASIFSVDPDFSHYAKHLPITLHPF